MESMALDNSDHHHDRMSDRSMASIRGTAGESSSSNYNNKPDHDAPESIVRKENAAVSIFRVIVMSILFLAAVGTATFVYMFTRETEVKAYETAFDGVGSRILEALLSDMTLKFGMASTIANSILIAINMSGLPPSNLTIPADNWKAVNFNTLLTGRVPATTWGPVLRGNEERMDFEAHVMAATSTTADATLDDVTTGTATTGTISDAFPPCYLCGSPNTVFTNPEFLVSVPGRQDVTCGEAMVAAVTGVFGNQCQLATDFIKPFCECGDAPSGTNSSTLADTKPDVIPKSVFRLDSETGAIVPEPDDQERYIPIWQVSGLDIQKNPAMFNHLSDQLRVNSLDRMFNMKAPLLSETYWRNDQLSLNYYRQSETPGAVLFFPIVKDEEIVAVVSLELTWMDFFSGVLPSLSEFIDVVITNECAGSFTFKVDLAGNRLVEARQGDLHDPAYDNVVFRSEAWHYYYTIQVLLDHIPEDLEDGICAYTYAVYSTREFEEQYRSNNPWIYSIVAAAIFAFSACVFLMYDMIVRRRQDKVMNSAIRTNNIVSSLFPENVRRRMFDERVAADAAANPSNGSASKVKMHTFLTNGGVPGLTSEPIADLFPHTTVMLLDIAGFTCWASERTPSDVFTLLERLYIEFDEIAKGMGVFKVETIGDSYVAVCGLPKPRANHAVVVARFAKACLGRMVHLTQELEVFLGPSTGDLRARIGLHSGPVTAGVLRGEKARFQLFGDTVNTAARIEASGIPHRIHASQELADQLIASGKSGWITPRLDKVVLKGKGEFQTFWINPRSGSTQSGDEVMSLDHLSLPDNSKRERLVDWNTEVLYRLLENLVVDRKEHNNRGGNASKTNLIETEARVEESRNGLIVLDEMTQIIQLPKTSKATDNQETINLGDEVKEQLREFILQISALYRDVPFHNFEHCSHVIMSASKLMKRIMDPDGIDHSKSRERVTNDIHEATYGMSSDPMMAFSVVFSALIHDVDHLGVTNQELCQMKLPTATRYRQKSVAEQNSVDVAWKVLRSDRFRELRSCIYSNELELRRFRQLVVNAVMATDIADRELKMIREKRWDAAFSDPTTDTGDGASDTDCKATIVFEYIIQASDIAHTMQHWHTYQKFNKRLFEERYVAFINGHCDKDPSVGWYGGELWFFDNYIIPLANKLKDCGVFGVSHFEFLTYAKQNRSEWVVKGKKIVADMLSECQQKYPANNESTDAAMPREETAPVCSEHENEIYRSSSASSGTSATSSRSNLDLDGYSV